MVPFLSVLTLLPRYCARSTCFLHPKLRKINAVLSTPPLIALCPAVRPVSSVGGGKGHKGAGVGEQQSQQPRFAMWRYCIC